MTAGFGHCSNVSILMWVYMDLQSVDGGYSDWFTAVEWIWMVIIRMILWSVVIFAEEDGNPIFTCQKKHRFPKGKGIWCIWCVLLARYVALLPESQSSREKSPGTAGPGVLKFEKFFVRITDFIRFDKYLMILMTLRYFEAFFEAFSNWRVTLPGCVGPKICYKTLWQLTFSAVPGNVWAFWQKQLGTECCT